MSYASVRGGATVLVHSFLQCPLQPLVRPPAQDYLPTLTSDHHSRYTSNLANSCKWQHSVTGESFQCQNICIACQFP